MNGIVCLVPSKDGQCTLLAGHTGFPHRSSNGREWEDETNITWSIHHKEKVAMDILVPSKAMDKVETTPPVKRGRGRPRKLFKDAQGKWYKNE